MVSGAAQSNTAKPANDLYAGVEISSDGVRAIVIQCSVEGELPGARMIFSEVIHQSLPQSRDGKLTSQAVAEAVRALNRLLKQIRQDLRVPEKQIYLIGSCELKPGKNRELLDAVQQSTGSPLILLDEATDAELSLSGTIPKRIREGDAWIDTRNSSVLIQLGMSHTRLGYQMLKYLPPSPPAYSITGTIIPSDYIDLRDSLHREIEITPSLLTRNNIYLSGDIAWAMAALLFPGDQRPYVQLNAALITRFAQRASADPEGVLYPDLAKIKEPTRREIAEREVAWVRDAFTPRQIVAAAVRLKLIATEFNFSEKRVWYARHGDLARLLIYVRLQAEK